MNVYLPVANHPCTRISYGIKIVGSDEGGDFRPCINAVTTHIGCSDQ